MSAVSVLVDIFVIALYISVASEGILVVLVDINSELEGFAGTGSIKGVHKEMNFKGASYID